MEVIAAPKRINTYVNRGGKIDNQLIYRCKQKDRAAMAELFGLLAPVLKGVCYRYCGNGDDAEDLLQESFIIIFTKLDTFKEEGSFEGWCRRITVNNCINWLKKNKKLNESVELTYKHEMQEEVEHYDDQVQRADKLMAEISRLPAGYRAVVNLFAIEGLSHKEIAAQLGITESTSRSQYARAKKVLQELWLKNKAHE